MSKLQKYAPIVLTIYVAFVFVQSLFFKFINAPETIVIFQTLDDWAYDLSGIAGIFNPGGIFSAYVIGTAELVASAALLIGLLPKLRIVGFLGGLLGLGIMSGAIVFHLFTPLGVVVGDEEIAKSLGVTPDGGLLFGMACGVWISCAILTWLRRDVALGLLNRNSAAHA